MAKQSWKQQMIQQIANKQVQQVMQQKQAEQLQASFNAWQKEQNDIAQLQASFDAWQKENAQPVQPVQTAPVQTVKEQPKQEAIPSLADFRTADNLQYRQAKRDIAQNKKRKEDYQREQQKENILASAKPKDNRTANQVFQDVIKKDNQEPQNNVQALLGRTGGEDQNDIKRMLTTTPEKKPNEKPNVIKPSEIAKAAEAEKFNEVANIVKDAAKDWAPWFTYRGSKWENPYDSMTPEQQQIVRDYVEQNKDNDNLSEEERKQLKDFLKVYAGSEDNEDFNDVAQAYNRTFNDKMQAFRAGIGGFVNNHKALVDLMAKGATKLPILNQIDLEEANTAYDTSVNDAMKLNPEASEVGRTAGQIYDYAVTTPIANAAAGALKLGKIATPIFNQVIQAAQDLAFDIVPEAQRMMDENGEIDYNELAKRGAIDVGTNVGMELIPALRGVNYDYLTKTVGDNADIFKNMTQSGTYKNLPDVVRNIADVANNAKAVNETPVENIATRQMLPGMETPEDVTNSINNQFSDIMKNYQPETSAMRNIYSADDLSNSLNEQLANAIRANQANEAIENAAKAMPETSVREAIDTANSVVNNNPAIKEEIDIMAESVTNRIYDVGYKVDAANNEALSKSYNELLGYEEKWAKAISNSTDIDEIKQATRDLNNAISRFNTRAKKVDPSITKDIYNKKFSSMLNSFNTRLDDFYNSTKRADEAAEAILGTDATKSIDNTPSKVMAEDIGISKSAPEPEPVRRTFEIPDTPENAPIEVRPSVPENVPPESRDYVSQFRTNNEHRFNLTDEELNNKYFSTDNENFHFMKGDRGADLRNATANLETDYDGTVNKILNKSTETPFTPQEVDEGFMAWNKELGTARQTGDYNKSANIMYRLTKDAHDKGGGLQAYAAWKKNTPAGVVLDASTQARKMAEDQFGKGYVKELDNLTDSIESICKSGDALENKIKRIDDLMREAQSKGYKNGVSGAEQMKELLASGSDISVSNIHDILYEANKVPNLSAQSQQQIADIASQMYGKELTSAEKRKYINQINMILSKERNWTIKDKAIEISHILMLSGTRTHLKNFVANVGMLPQEALARKISAIGQNAYKHLVDPNYKPTQAFKVSKEAKALAEESYVAKGGADAIAEGVADKFTNQIADQIGANYMFGVGKENVASKANKALVNAIPGLKKVEDAAGELTEKTLKKIGAEGAYDAMDANVSLLENYRQAIYGSLSGLEDNPFVKQNYVDRLASYIQAQGFKSIDEIPEEAFDIARAEAVKATFKDDNAITELFKKIKNLPVIGELIFPFLKTPANLLARSIDFSPIGLARSLYGAINKNSRFAKNTIGETIDEIAKGLGGTTTMALGMWLYANGLITGKKSDDPEIANYMSNEGWQEYSISTKGVSDFINSRLGTNVDLGDNYYDFSFMQPSTTNMIAAEEVWDELMDGKKLTEKDIDSIFNRVKSIAGSYTDALLAQSTMQNVADLFGSQYTDDGVGGNLIQSGLEWPTRFTSGAISDIAKLGDDTKREYYSKNKPLETVKNAVVSKLPVLSKTLPAKYDVFGEEMTRNKTEGQKWFNTLLNPTSTTQRNDNPLYDYVDSINEQSTSGDYIPDKTLRKIKLNDETEYSLDNKDYSEASRIAGETRTTFLNEVQKNSLFKSLNADDQAAILNNLEKVATSKAYTSINENAKVSQEAQKYMDMYKNGGVDAVVKDYIGRQMVKNAGVSSNSKVAEQAKAAVNNGNVDEANKILNAETEMKTAITNAGLEVNDTTKGIYQNDGNEGLKTWSSMTSNGLTDKRAYDVYHSAVSGTDPIPTLDKWISTYKTIDSLSKPNGHVDQTEFKAYLTKGNYTIDQAEELARIYGDWTTTPYINKKGQWSFH